SWQSCLSVRPSKNLEAHLRLAFDLLTSIFLVLHVEIFALGFFMQLERITLGGRKPASQSLFELFVLRCRESPQISIYSQIVAHRIAFQSRPHIIDIDGLAIWLFANDSESHLGTPHCAKIVGPEKTRLRSERGRDGPESRQEQCHKAEPKMPKEALELLEVHGGGAEDGVDGIAGSAFEPVAFESVFGLEVADGRLDGGAAF